MSIPTRREIESSQPTRAQLAEWCVPWPPPRGWRKKLLAAADSAAGYSHRRETRRRARAFNRLPAEEFFEVGDVHPVWPEWRWDGESWRRV